MDIKVLGAGCSNCKATMALIEQVARDRGVPVQLSKVEDLREIMSFGVMSTPGVVIDGKVVHAGGLPSREKIERWLTPAMDAQGPAACCRGSRAPAEAEPDAARGCCADTGCC